MMDFLGLILVTLGIVAAVAGATAVAHHRTRAKAAAVCSTCGAPSSEDESGCTVCDAPMNRPPPEATQRARTVTVKRSLVVDAKGGTLNPGVRPWMIKAALGVMFGGLAVRVIGMLEPAGLSVPVPDTVMALLTVLGGLAAFVGFVVLDVA